MPGANNNMNYNVSHEIEGNEVVEGGEVGACGLYACVCGDKKKIRMSVSGLVCTRLCNRKCENVLT